MATISSTSSASSGSTLDVQGIVSQLMTVEQVPLTKLQTVATGLNTQVSAFGKLKSLLSTFQDAARGLSSLDTWQSSTVKSSDETVIKATSTTGASKGSMSVTVQQLAQSQSAVSGQFASGTAVVGGGTLSIQLGTAATGGGFTADGTRAAVNLTIPPGATLADIRTAINGANAGVSASLVNDGSTTRLMIRSSETGASNAFSVQVSGAETAGATGLGALNYTPGGSGGMTAAQTAQDAMYALDGLPLTSASNTVSNAVDGVSFSLQKISTSPVTIDVNADQTSMRAAVDKFVTAYNALNSGLADLTKYDPTTKTAGDLQGNFVAVGLRAQLRTVLTQTVGTTGITTLSNAGISIQRDGSLLVDDNKFNAAAADPSALKSLFASASVPGVNGAADTGGGIATRFNRMITLALGVDGSLTGALDTLAKRKTDNQKQQDALNDRLTATQARLTKLYSSLDANLSTMQNLSNSLTSSLAGLSSNTSG